jgi:pimeloyl-ACP methyl ester carboxylesterase
MEFTTATAHSQKFVYADSGEGPLVVLFHGFPDLPTGWADTREVLHGAGYRTVVPYLRGYHPDTLVPGRKYGGEEIAGDAIRLLDAIGAQDAVFVGHDWGAAITYRAAELAPDRVRAVVPVAIPHPRMLKPSPSLAWKGRHFLTLRVPSRAWLARRDDFEYIDTLMRRWAPNWSGPARDACLADVKRAFADPRVLDGALGYYRNASREAVGRLSQPALVVGGTTDLIAPDVFRESTNGFDGECEVAILEGAGHWPHREAAAEFQEKLVAFLGKLA